MNNANKFKIAIAAGALLAGGGWGILAMAESHLGEADNPFRALRIELRETHEGLRTEIREKEMMFREEAMEKREDLRAELMEAEPADRMRLMESFREDVAEKRMELRAEIKEKREDFREASKERIESLKEHVGEKRAQRIEEYFSRMVRKFEAAIDRLTVLADRIDERLDRFEDFGKDVSRFRETLEDARGKIAGAEDALSAAKEELGNMVLDENPREAFKAVKDLVHTIVVEVKDAHAALVDVIHSIKGSSGRLIDEKHGEEEEEHEEENGTSTPDN